MFAQIQSRHDNKFEK